MAINIVREFLIEIKVQLARTARRSLDGLDGQLGQIEKSASNAVSALRSLTVVGVGLGTAMGFTAKAAADFGENVRRSATGLGVSEKEYQKLHATFGLLDADVGDLQDAMGTVTDRVTDALEGNKTYRKELRRLGVDIKSLKGQNPAQLFESIATAGAKVADKNQVVTASVRLFGDDLGRKLLPALVGGGENLAELGRRLEATGLLMSKYGVAQTKAAAMEYRFLWFVLKRLTILFGQKLAPMLRHYSELMGKILVANREFIERGMDEAVDTLFRTFQHLVAVLRKVNRAIHELGGYEALFARLKLAFIGLSAVIVGGPLLKILVGLPAVLGGANAALRGIMFTFGKINLGMAAATAGFALLPVIKIMALAAAFALAALAVEDLWSYANGGLSVIGDLISAGGNFGTAMSAAVYVTLAMFRAFEAMIRGVVSVIGWATGSGEAFGEVVTWLAKALAVTLVAALGAVVFMVGMLVAPIALGVAVTMAIVGAIIELVKVIWWAVTAVWDFIRALGRLVGGALGELYLFFAESPKVREWFDEAIAGWDEFAAAVDVVITKVGEVLSLMGKLGSLPVFGPASAGSAAASAALQNASAQGFAASSSSSSSNTTNTFNQTNAIDARGADAAAIERLPGQIMSETDKRRKFAAFSGGER